MRLISRIINNLKRVRTSDIPFDPDKMDSVHSEGDGFITFMYDTTKYFQEKAKDRNIFVLYLEGDDLPLECNIIHNKKNKEYKKYASDEDGETPYIARLSETDKQIMLKNIIEKVDVWY